MVFSHDVAESATTQPVILHFLISVASWIRDDGQCLFNCLYLRVLFEQLVEKVTRIAHDVQLVYKKGLLCYLIRLHIGFLRRRQEKVLFISALPVLVCAFLLICDDLSLDLKHFSCLDIDHGRSLSSGRGPLSEVCFE